jgi:hypothetical protein
VIARMGTVIGEIPPEAAGGGAAFLIGLGLLYFIIRKKKGTK